MRPGSEISVRISSITASILSIAVPLVSLLACVTPALSAEFHLGPSSEVSGVAKSNVKTSTSLQSLIENRALNSGDSIFLRSGDYSVLRIIGHRNQGPITIIAEPGHTPRFSGITIANSANWVLRGLDVLGRNDRTHDTRKALVTLSNDVSRITIEGSVIASSADIAGWSAADWRARARGGIRAGGAKITLRNNKINNVRHGLTVVATHSLVEGNTIENFSGDGIRGLGNYTTFRANLIKNCYDVDDNHDDGFQSWSRGPSGPGTGVVEGVVLSGNTIINYESPKQSHRCRLQGIGLFDGMYKDWVIENNVVITDHWHGITVMGAINVRVVNNTVLDPNDMKPGPPWITITRHKNGTMPKNSIIANNLAPSFNRVGHRLFPATAEQGVILRNNIVVEQPRDFFRDVDRRDVRLKPGSQAIDAGDRNLAPKKDIGGRIRPQGSGVDVGAYENW